MSWVQSAQLFLSSALLFSEWQCVSDSVCTHYLNLMSSLFKFHGTVWRSLSRTKAMLVWGVLKLNPQKYNEVLSQATISGSKLSKHVVQLCRPWKHLPSPFHFLSWVEETVHALCSTIDSLCLSGNTEYYVHKTCKTLWGKMHHCQWLIQDMWQVR